MLNANRQQNLPETARSISGLNVLHLVQSIGRRSAGMGSAAVGLVREQLSLGCHATIWTLDREPATELAQENDLPPQAIRCFPSVGPKAVGYSPTMELASKKSTGQSFSLMHQHGIWMANSRVANEWRKASARPTVLSPHGSLEEYALRIARFKKNLATLAYEAKNLREATCLMASSANEARSFRRYGLRPANRSGPQRRIGQLAIEQG